MTTTLRISPNTLKRMGLGNRPTAAEVVAGVTALLKPETAAANTDDEAYYAVFPEACPSAREAAASPSAAADDEEYYTFYPEERPRT